MNRTSRFALLIWGVGALALLFSTVISTPAQNLVSNPGFESGLAGWSPRGPETLQNSSPAKSGANSVRVTNRTQPWHGVQQSMLNVLQPGDTYVVGAWVKTSSATPQIVRLSFQLNYASRDPQYRSFAGAQAGTEWTYLVGVYTLQPADTLTGLFFYVDAPPAGVDIFVDDVEVRQVGAGGTGNVLINPDFELGEAGWSPRGPENLVSFGPAHSGGNAVRVTDRTETWQGVRQSVLGLMELNRTYVASGWVRTSSETPQTVRMSFQMDYAGSPTTYPQVSIISVGNQWTKISGTFAVEPTAMLTGLSFYFSGPDAGVDLMVDDVSLSVLAFDAPENLLSNPGFEPGNSGWFGFGFSDLAMTAGHTGANAVLVENRTETYQGPGQVLTENLVYGGAYFFSGWVKTDSAGQEPVRATLRFVENGAPVFRQVASGTASADGWVWLSGTYRHFLTGAISSTILYIDGPSRGVDLSVDDLYFARAQGLRAAAANFPQIRMGVAGINNGDLGNNAAYETTAATHFHIIGPGNALKFDNTQPTQGNYSWYRANSIIDFSQAHGGNARGHVFVWHRQIPSWVTGGGFSESELQGILFDHIATVGGHYADRLFAWDVVNEAISDSGGALRATPWYNQPGIGFATEGAEYIAEAFRRARMADPDAELYYNDYSIDIVNTKSTAVYNMLSDFIANDVPVDGIGLQAHLVGTSFNYGSFRENLQRFQDLGLDIHITEFDDRLNVDGNGNASAEDIAAQGDVFFNFLGTALAFESMKVFQLWGVDDVSSWIPDAFPGFGAALAFDGNFDKKPAYWGLYNALANQAEKLFVSAISTGDTHTVETDTLFSGGGARKLSADSAQDFFNVLVNIPFPGEWDVQVGVGQNAEGGEFQLAVSPFGAGLFVDMGSSFDTYSPALTTRAVQIGTQTFANAGTYAFRFTAVGSNAMSTGHNLLLDYIRPTPVDCSPFIPAIPDQFIDMDESLPRLAFFAEDDIAAGTLTVTATSSDQTLLPDENIQITGNSPYYWISAAPLVNQSGVATITVSATDGVHVGERSFDLTVTSQPNLIVGVGSFETVAEGTSVTTPPDIIDATTIPGWRVFNVDSANISFNATIIENASAGSHALRLDVNNTDGGSNYALDRWQPTMHTPVQRESNYIISFDAAWITGATADNLLFQVQEFDSSGAFLGNGISRSQSVSTADYRTHTFIYSPLHSGTSGIGLSFGPMRGVTGTTSISIDSVRMVSAPAAVNGDFEFNPFGTSAGGEGQFVDTETFQGWRLFSVGTPPITSLTGTIVNAGDYNGGQPGGRAMRLDTSNTGSPAGHDYGLDNDHARTPVIPGNKYTLAFDLELDGIIGGPLTFNASIAEFDAAGAFTGEFGILTPTLPTDQFFHRYSLDYVVTDPTTTHVTIAFRPATTGVSALVLDNVTFTPFITGTPTNISVSISRDSLEFTWPESHLGWVLQSNSVSIADPISWEDIPDSESLTSLSVPIDLEAREMFYRLYRRE